MRPETGEFFSQHGRVVSAELHSGVLAYRVATDGGGELPLTPEELEGILCEVESLDATALVDSDAVEAKALVESDACSDASLPPLRPSCCEGGGHLARAFAGWRLLWFKCVRLNALLDAVEDRLKQLVVEAWRTSALG